MVLALMLLCTAALAEVCATGDVNLRLGPGLDYGTVGYVPAGTVMEYLGETSTDSRGVDWYKVSVQGSEVWVSSRYSELTQETPKFEFFTPQPGSNAYDPDGEKTELSGFYMAPLEQAAAEIGLTGFEVVSSEAPNQYYDGGARIGGDAVVEFIQLTGPGYTVYGVALGMKIEEAMTLLSRAGLDLTTDRPEIVVFEHPSDENSFVDVEGHDSCINLWCENGVVTELDWSTYTG